MVERKDGCCRLPSGWRYRERERETEWILKGSALIDETHGIRHGRTLQDIERLDSDCSLFMQARYCFFAARSKSRVISQDA